MNTAGSWKKVFKNVAAGKIFGSSYFVTAFAFCRFLSHSNNLVRCSVNRTLDNINSQCWQCFKGSFTNYVDKAKLYLLGWAQWNLSRFEFKLDDTRLSLSYKNRIGLIKFFFVASWHCSVSALLALSVYLVFLIRPIIILYYEESLVFSNLNSKLFMFHCVRPNLPRYANSWFKKVNISFLKSRVVWFKKDLCSKPKNRSSERNTSCRWICNLRSFLNLEFTILCIW